MTRDAPPIIHVPKPDADAIERAATRIEVPRPTPAPFPWADPFFTVGVTGTNGKTSTTVLIAHILRAAGRSVLTETTVGYDLDGAPLDVPRTLQGFFTALKTSSMRGCRHAAIEATSNALARGYAKMWRFDLGVFTNLSRDHLAAHGSWEHYLASKAQLFVHLGPGRTAVLNGCDETSLLLDQITPADVRRVWYGAPTRGKAIHALDLEASSVRVSAHGTEVSLVPGELAERLGGRLHVGMIGAVFAENAMAAACAALASGVPDHAIREGLTRCPGVPGRFQIVHREPLVVIDYAHTPDALLRTLDAAREIAGDGRVLAVFGAGGERDQDKREPMGRAVGQRADVAIVTNDNPRSEDPQQIAKAVAAGCRRGGRAYVTVELERRRAIERALTEARAGDVVLIAGKGHEVGQEIAGQVHPFSDEAEVRRWVGDAPQGG